MLLGGHNAFANLQKQPTKISISNDLISAIEKFVSPPGLVQRAVDHEISYSALLFVCSTELALEGSYTLPRPKDPWVYITSALGSPKYRQKHPADHLETSW